MNRGKFIVIMSTATLLSIFSCSRYVVRHDSKGPLKDGSIIGLVVESSDDKQLSSLMISALIGKNFKVRVVDPYELIPYKIMKFLTPDGQYSLMSAIIEQISSGGKMKGNSEIFNKLITINEIKESKIRLKDFLEMLEELLNKWSLDYCMFLYPGPTEYTYMCRIIKIKEKEIVFSYYVNANRRGWRKNVKMPRKSINIRISKNSNKEIPAIHIQLCEEIADLIKTY